MVTANELVKQQKERDERKKVTFEKIYVIIEKKIIMASAGNSYYTWYQIPEFLVGLPMYSIEECQKYVQTKLQANGFDTEFFEPNLIHIKWYPKDKNK
jgi:hypothetical protein